MDYPPDSRPTRQGLGRPIPPPNYGVKRSQPSNVNASKQDPSSGYQHLGYRRPGYQHAQYSYAEKQYPQNNSTSRVEVVNCIVEEPEDDGYYRCSVLKTIAYPSMPVHGSKSYATTTEIKLQTRDTDTTMWSDQQKNRIGYYADDQHFEQNKEYFVHLKFKGGAEAVIDKHEGIGVLRALERTEEKIQIVESNDKNHEEKVRNILFGREGDRKGRRHYNATMGCTCNLVKLLKTKHNVKLK